MIIIIYPDIFLIPIKFYKRKMLVEQTKNNTADIEFSNGKTDVKMQI